MKKLDWSCEEVVFKRNRHYLEKLCVDNWLAEIYTKIDRIL